MAKRTMRGIQPEWIDFVASGKPLTDIGQLTTQTQLRLRQLVAEGTLVEARNMAYPTPKPSFHRADTPLPANHVTRDA